MSNPNPDPKTTPKADRKGEPMPGSHPDTRRIDHGKKADK